MSAAQPGDRVVEGRVNYIGAMRERPRYYANDHSRDVLTSIEMRGIASWFE